MANEFKAGEGKETCTKKSKPSFTQKNTF